MPLTTWSCLEPNVETILAAEANPIARVAAGDVAAIILRQAFPADECRSLVRYLIDQGLMFETGDNRVDENSLDIGHVDRWMQQGLNPAESSRKRIDLGASLGNFGQDKEDFLRRSAEAHELFDRLFAERANPITAIYDCLRRLAPQNRVATAYEPDGRQYGPAIFRIHYGGYTYGPHFDSVRLRESRSGYAVHKYERQMAGVLCVQNSTINAVTAQGIVHRQFWNADVDPKLKEGTFHDYAQEQDIEQVRVELEPGDLYFFNTGLIHEVPGVPGDLPRIVLATFIGYSPDEEEIMVWS